MAEIDEDVVEATWREAAALTPSRARAGMERAGREQPELLGFVLESTRDYPTPVHELAVYTYFVIWQAFRRSTKGKFPRIKPAAIERKFEENTAALLKLEGAHARFLEKAAIQQITAQPALFRYMAECIFEAGDDDGEPIEIDADAQGELFLVLKTAIDVLDEASDRAK